jgi:hypothetical protein
MSDPYGQWTEKRLIESQNESRKPYWNKIYSDYFPSMVSSSFCDGDDSMKWQELGIDRIIFLKDGRRVYVDEKIRYKSYDQSDILLEESSSIEYGTPGWIEKDNQCSDYIFYHVIPTNKTYVLPTHSLRRAWVQHKEEWKEKYKKVLARNSRYTSLGWAVPVVSVFLAIAQSNVIG